TWLAARPSLPSFPPRRSSDLGAFDGVFCFGVIFTTSDWRRALGEMTRVLAPGGLLYANENGIGYYKHAFTQQPNKRDGHDPRKRSEEHTSDLQSRFDLVCRLL